MTPWRLSGPDSLSPEAAIDVTVEIDRDGKVIVTIGDETGYSPDTVDDFCRRARETALVAHRELHPSDV